MPYDSSQLARLHIRRLYRLLNQPPDRFGARGQVGLLAAPIVDHAQEFFRDAHLKRSVLNPAGWAPHFGIDLYLSFGIHLNYEPIGGLPALARAKEQAIAQPRSITRRHLVAAAVPLAVGASFPARACARDPIFAAIAAHRRVYAEILALLDAQTAADQAVQRADDITRPALESRLNELCRAEGPLGRLEIRASKRMAATVPTTLEGAVAVLRYLRELFARGDYAPFEDDGYRTLLFATERAIKRHCEADQA